jgi:hypothetical protein
MSNVLSYEGEIDADITVFANNVCTNGASSGVNSLSYDNLIITWTGNNDKGHIIAGYQPMPNNMTIPSLMSTYGNNSRVAITFSPQFKLTQTQIARINNSANLLTKTNLGSYRGYTWNYWNGGQHKCLSPKTLNSKDTCKEAVYSYMSDIQYQTVNSKFKCASLMNPTKSDCCSKGYCQGSTGCFKYSQQFTNNLKIWSDTEYPVQFRFWSQKVCNSGSLCNGGSCTCSSSKTDGKGSIIITMRMYVKVVFTCEYSELESPVCIAFCQYDTNVSNCMRLYDDYCGTEDAKGNIPISYQNGGCRQYYHTALPVVKNHIYADTIINNYCQNVRYKTLSALIESINNNPSNSTISLCACHMNSASYRHLASQIASKMNGVNPAALQGACMVNACVNSKYPNTDYSCHGPACVNIAVLSNGASHVQYTINQQCLVQNCTAYPQNPLCNGSIKTPCQSQECSCSQNAQCPCPSSQCSQPIDNGCSHKICSCHKGAECPCPPNPSPCTGPDCPKKKMSKKTMWIIIITCISVLVLLLLIIIIAISVSVHNKNKKKKLQLQAQQFQNIAKYHTVQPKDAPSMMVQSNLVQPNLVQPKDAPSMMVQTSYPKTMTGKMKF